MFHLRTVAGLLAFTLTFSCQNQGSQPSSSSPEPESFRLQLIGGEKPSFQPSDVKLDLRPDTKKSAIVLANYPFELKPKKANSVAKLESEGQIRIHITINGGEGATFENPLPVGTYDAGTTAIDEYTFVDGKQKRKNVKDERGEISIVEVTDTHISGKLDVTGGEDFQLKGDFRAEIVR